MGLGRSNNAERDMGENMSRCIRNGVVFKRHNRTKSKDGSWQPCIHCGQPEAPQATEVQDDQGTSSNIEAANFAIPVGTEADQEFFESSEYTGAEVNTGVTE